MAGRRGPEPGGFLLKHPARTTDNMNVTIDRGKSYPCISEELLEGHSPSRSCADGPSLLLCPKPLIFLVVVPL